MVTKYRGFFVVDAMYDRATGSLIGLAIGNALGASVQGEHRDKLDPVTDMRGGGKFNLAPGEYTDDTMMALVLAESLVSCNGLDEKDFLQRLCEKHDSNAYLNIHRKFIRILTDFKNLGTVVALEHKRPRRNKSILNDSITRLAPVAIFLNYNVREAITAAVTQCKTTQTLPLYQNISQLMAFDMIMFYNNAPLDRMWVKESLPTDQETVDTSGDPAGLHTAVKWAIKTTDNFKDAVLSIVNLGGASEVAGAMIGQYAGAVYGLSGIPQEWVDQLAHKDYILELAGKLYYEDN